MAKAKKLPSGSWRCLAYSHTERIWDEKKKEWKDKRIYESFTSDDPSPQGKREAEAAAAMFQVNKTTPVHLKSREHGNMTLSEAIEKYLASSSNVLSGTTTQGYRKKQYDSYQFLMSKRLKDITEDDLQNAVNNDAVRPSKRSKSNPKPISPKTVKNTYGFITSAIHRYYPEGVYNVRMPVVPEKIKELLDPKLVLNIIRGTDIELPCLLAIWLSFSMSEIRGIKVRDISDNCLTINQVVVDIGCTPTQKNSGKAIKRLRKHQIPPYIMSLIQQAIECTSGPDDYLIQMSGHAIYMKWTRLLKDNNLPHMTFHDLRHENASIMHALKIPDKYAMERGGWKTDKVMKRVYTHTFSDERTRADNIINSYFENMLSQVPAPDDFDQKKYEAWLTLFGKQPSEQSKKEYSSFMQHEMQHKKEKA